jgi:hypothetical protein
MDYVDWSWLVYVLEYGWLVDKDLTAAVGVSDGCVRLCVLTVD